jgi:hypothetical protein
MDIQEQWTQTWEHISLGYSNATRYPQLTTQDSSDLKRWAMSIRGI